MREIKVPPLKKGDKGGFSGDSWQFSGFSTLISHKAKQLLFFEDLHLGPGHQRLNPGLLG
jgi:hypothetical protein